MTMTPEFSRPVPLASLGKEPFRREIAATEAERAALARRLDLPALDRLAAIVELVREGGETILLRAEFEAAFTQSCVVTLDPVEGALAASFSLRYGPPETEEPDAGSGDEEPAFEPLTGDSVDIGEAVAQEFSLALPTFPRSPDAVVESEAVAPDPGPFSVLSRLLDDRKE